MKNDRYEFILKNLDCANCANKIQETIAKEEVFSDVIVNFNTTKLTFTTTLEKDVKDIIEKIVKRIEPEVEVIGANKKEELLEKHGRKIVIQGITLLLGIILFTLSFIWKEASNTLIPLSYIVLLHKTAINGIKRVWKNKALDENILITISVIGAYLIGEKVEGLLVILLYEIGKLLEAKAINKSRKSIKSLMDIKPKYANLKVGEGIKKISPEEVKVGDILIIKTGEEVPLDGVIIEGEGKFDTSTLTGESVLQIRKTGDEILSGTTLIEGIITTKVIKEYKDSTVSRMLELVENATDRKARTENFVSRAARIYTPIVIMLAAIVAIFMPIVIKQATYSDSIYRALTFLVISCPCAIAISVPLSYFSGIGKASKLGILVKGSDYLDGIRNIKTVIFDKTGTITKGNFNISKIEVLNEGYSEDSLLEIVALGENLSNHPIAKTIVKKYEDVTNKKVESNKSKKFKEISGLGISYELEQNTVLIGNAELVGIEKENEEGTILYISINKEVIGKIVIKDEVKENAKSVIQHLKKLGINTKMLTGDKESVAKEIAKQVGIEEYYANMLPEDKYKKLEEILKTRDSNKEKVTFVGDGINDSPVLALSDLGISMGGIGSKSAVEASDIVIMADDLNKIIDGIEISKKTNQIIKQNLIFAIATKVIFLILSLFGYTGMWQAIFADVGVTIITVLNSIRILK